MYWNHYRPRYSHDLFVRTPIKRLSDDDFWAYPRYHNNHRDTYSDSDKHQNFDKNYKSGIIPTSEKNYKSGLNQGSDNYFGPNKYYNQYYNNGQYYGRANPYDYKSYSEPCNCYGANEYNRFNQYNRPEPNYSPRYYPFNKPYQPRQRFSPYQHYSGKCFN